MDARSAVAVDYRGVADGRGAWLCVNSDCLRRAVKRASFARSFRRRVHVPANEGLIYEVSAGLLHSLEVATRATRRVEQDAAHTRAVALARRRYRSWTGESTQAEESSDLGEK